MLGPGVVAEEGMMMVSCVDVEARLPAVMLVIWYRLLCFNCSSSWEQFLGAVPGSSLMGYEKEEGVMVMVSCVDVAARPPVSHAGNLV